ncbi:MAG: hypothetical protein GEV09_08575 [Pseudonocardiaceae bacterium]|nr:hypothetical protein [Pseudonocardiaceae bacterium]
MAAPAATAPADHPPGATARNSATVAGWTLISRVTGLLRVVVIGAVLGPTYFANTFQAGYVVPNLVYTVIAGPVLAMVLVPSLVRAVSVGGVQRAREVLAKVSGCMLGVAAVVAVLLVLVAPLVAWTLTFGIPDAGDRARGQWLTTLLVLFVAPQVLLYTVAALGVAAQQARGRFALAAAAPAVENLVLIAAVIAAGAYYGTGLQLDEVPVDLVIMLGLSSTLAVAVHAALQLFGTARVGVLTRPSRGWRRDPDATGVARRMLRSIGVAACPTAAMYVLLALAGTVPGGVFVVQLAYAVFYALSYVSARAVSMAVLPRLAAAAGGEDGATFGSTWRQGLSYAMIASLPLLLLLAIFASPTADILANGELRQAALIGELAACLAVVAVAQLIGGVHDIGRQALFARLDDRGPRRASEVALVVTLLVATLVMLMPSDGRLLGLVLAILAGELAAAGIVLSRLRRAIAPQRLVDPGPLRVATLAALAMLPVAATGYLLQRVADADRFAQAVLLTLVGLMALAVYVAVLRFGTARRVGGVS